MASASNDTLSSFEGHQESHDVIVMSVDDDDVNQEVLRGMLEATGFTIITCMDGFEATAYLEDETKDKPHIILLDLMMPGMDGYDVCRRIRKNHSLLSLPIIMISANAELTAPSKAFRLGCNDWILKPFRSDNIITRIELQLMIRSAARTSQRSTQDTLTHIPNMAPQARIALKPALISSCALWVTLSMSLNGDGIDWLVLAKLFEAYSQLCHAHGIKQIEFIGACFLAVECDGDGDTEKLLLLSLSIQDTTKKVALESNCKVFFKAGIHRDQHLAPVIDNAIGRQYPRSSLCGPTVQTAMRLSALAAPDRIHVSHGAHQAIGRAAEQRLKSLGHQLVRGRGVEGHFQEYFCVVRSGANAVGQDLVDSHSESWPRAAAATQPSDFGAFAPRSRTSAPPRFHVANSAPNSHSSSGMGEQCPGRGSEANDAVSAGLFAQWHNAHLQTDLRHARQHLFAAKQEAAMQTARAADAEKSLSLLSQRVEHLELDLSFRAACVGASGIS